MPKGQGPVATTWWLVRHGPVLNPQNLIYGRGDWPIDTQDPGLYLPLVQALPWDAQILTSSKKRAVQTLAQVATLGGFPVPTFQKITAFDEQSFGDWEGQTWDALFRDGRSHAFWLAPAHVRPPGGESFEDVMDRVAQGLRSQTAQHRGKDVLLFAHGGTIRAAVAHALGLDAETALQFSIANCSITRLTHLTVPEGDDSWRVDFVNRLG